MILAFDDFELDPERLELRRGGVPVKADPVALRLLSCLLRRAGQLVTKQELIAEVWGGRAVAENVITVTMVRLRRTLGHKPKERELIVNVHGRGYRFARPVRELAAELPPIYTRAAHAGAATAPPFVGRERVLAQLRAALAQAQSGRGSACALIGEAGIGKTRAVEVFEQEARPSSVPFVWGYCREAGEAPPLWPFAQLVRGLLTGEGGSALRARLGKDGGALARLVPELELAGGTAASAPGDSSVFRGARYRVYDAVARLFALAAETGPYVLVLEDLHRADPASLELLRYLVDEIARTQVLLLGTVRSGERPENAAADADLRYALGHRNCTRVALSRLSRADVAAYVTALLGEANDALGRAVYDKSEGNPFFMTELARQLDGDPRPDATALAVPDAALDIVRQRLSRLDAAARGVLSCAAVIGRSFELPVLEAASECAPSALMASLDDALASEAVVAAPDSRTAFAFGHELLRAVLYDALPAAERRACHLRVALALERRRAAGDPVLTADLAYHFHAALPHAELRKTVQYCIEAARDAGRVYASADAARYLRHARQALDLMEGGSPRLRLNLMLEESLHVRVHAPAEFPRLIADVIRVAREQQAGAVLARAALLLDPNPGFPPLPGSRAALVQALALLPEHDVATRAAVLARLAVSAPLAFDGERSAEQLERALALAEGLAAPLAHYTARIAELHRFGGPAHAATADQALRALEALCRKHPAMLSVPPVLLDVHRAIVALQAGALAEMTAALERGEARCRAIDNRELLWHIQRFQALVHWNAGAHARAAERLSELHARAEREQLHGAALFTAYDRVVVLGSAPSADPAVRAALAVDDDDPPNVWSMKVRALAAAGLQQDARAALERVPAARLAALPCDRDYLGTLGALTRAALDLRARDYFEPLHALLAPFSDRFCAHVSFACEGSAAQLCGLLAHALGRPDARAQLEAGLALSERAGLATSAAQARLALERAG